MCNKSCWEGADSNRAMYERRAGGRMHEARLGGANTVGTFHKMWAQLGASLSRRAYVRSSSEREEGNGK